MVFYIGTEIASGLVFAQRRFKLMNGQWMALQDGTEAIESTIKMSLALLERRERLRNERKRSARGAPRRNSSRQLGAGFL